MLWLSILGLMFSLVGCTAVVAFIVRRNPSPWWAWLLLIVNAVGITLNGLTVWARLS